MANKLAILATCLLFIIIPIVSASQTTESFTIYTDKQQYMIGETVKIYVKANSIDPGNTITITDVVVKNPYGASIKEWHHISIELPDTTTIKLVGTLTATTQGTYSVSATAYGCTWLLYAGCNFTVVGNSVPEVPFGTIAVAAALLGATGLYITKTKHRTMK